MNRGKLIAFATTLAILGILAALAWAFLEIYPATRWDPPSREARSNEYLALDRWLTATGSDIRITRRGNITSLTGAQERNVFVQASLFDWTAETALAEGNAVTVSEKLLQWIESGGNLFLVLDYLSEWEFRINRELIVLLEEFEIEVTFGWSSSPQDDERSKDEYYDVDDEQLISAAYPSAATFSSSFAFTVPPGDNIRALSAPGGQTRLVQIRRGDGVFTVTGTPLFLRSPNLRNEDNAALAWALFSADSGDGAWLFIRGAAQVRGLVGSLFRYGNFAVFIISAIIFIIVCFWAVIPMFGTVRGERAKAGKPLGERFSAEGRFFKRHGALGFYRDVYMKEIRRRFVVKEGLHSDDEINDRVLVLLGKTADETESRLFAAALRKEPVRYKDLPSLIIIFRTILERV